MYYRSVGYTEISRPRESGSSVVDQGASKALGGEFLVDSIEGTGNTSLFCYATPDNPDITKLQLGHWKREKEIVHP